MKSWKKWSRPKTLLYHEGTAGGKKNRKDGKDGKDGRKGKGGKEGKGGSEYEDFEQFEEVSVESQTQEVDIVDGCCGCAVAWMIVCLDERWSGPQLAMSLAFSGHLLRTWRIHEQCGLCFVFILVPRTLEQFMVSLSLWTKSKSCGHYLW